MRSQVISESEAFRLLQDMYTYLNALELFKIVDPDNIMTPKERSETWDAYRKDYVKFFKALPFGTREAVISRMNVLEKDSWRRCDSSYQQANPFQPLTDLKVYRGIEGIIVLDKLINEMPTLSFLLRMGINKPAVDEFVEKLEGRENNRAYFLLCMMDNFCKSKVLNELAIC